MDNERLQNIPQPADSGDEIEIDLVEIFYLLLDHWKQIAASAVMLAVTALLFTTFLMTPQYSSTSILYVLSKSTSITSFADIQIGSSLTTDYMEVVGGRPVLDQVIEDLELDMDYKELSSKLSFENPADSRMLKITATDENPKLAKKIVDDVAKISSSYIAEKMAQDSPSIIQYGYITNRPVSPRRGRTTIIAGILGALLMMGVVVANYLINDTIITPDDLERKVGINVLGTIPLDEKEAKLDRESRKKRKKMRRERRRRKNG